MVREVSISGRHNGYPISGHARLMGYEELPGRYLVKYRKPGNRRTILPPDVAYSLKTDWIEGRLCIRKMAAKYGLKYDAVRMYAQRAGWPARTRRPISSMPLPINRTRN